LTVNFVYFPMKSIQVLIFCNLQIKHFEIYHISQIKSENSTLQALLNITLESSRDERFMCNISMLPSFRFFGPLKVYFWKQNINV